MCVRAPDIQSLSPDLRRKVDAQRRAHVDAARAAEVKQEQELVRVTYSRSLRHSRTQPRHAGSSDLRTRTFYRGAMRYT